MKHNSLLLLMLTAFCGYSQTVKVLPSFKVKYTNVRATYKENNNRDLRTMVYDIVSRDTVKYYIATTGYDVNAVELTFVEGQIIPKYYNWSDSGLGVTRADFQSYDILLNKSSYKMGDTIMGRIKATGYLDRGSGQTYEFTGDFRHIVENTPEVREKREPIKRKPKTYTPTGFYTVLLHEGDNFKLPHYILSGNNYCLYSEEPLFNGAEFSDISRTFDTKKQQLTLKFKIKSGQLDKFKHEKEFGLPVALVVDDVLLEVISDMVIDKENYLVVSLKVKDKKEADRITQALHRKVNK